MSQLFLISVLKNTQTNKQNPRKPHTNFHSILRLEALGREGFTQAQEKCQSIEPFFLHLCALNEVQSPVLYFLCDLFPLIYPNNHGQERHHQKQLLQVKTPVWKMDRSFAEAVLAGENIPNIYNRVSGRGNVGGLFLQLM